MTADLIIKSNIVFDSVYPGTFPGFVAIKGNRILHVGHYGEEIDPYVDAHTIVKEYQEKLVMAGFHDSHTHLLMAGLFKSCVDLSKAISEEECVQWVKEAEDASGRTEGWVIGACWHNVFWKKKDLPTKASLDRVFPDRPVCLINMEFHSAWVNSKALEVVGIGDDTPDPHGGEILRDENGEATGYLYEAATGLVTKYAFDFTPKEEKNILKNFMEDAKKKGITSVNDVQAYFHGNMGNLEAYHQMDLDGELTIRIHAAPDLLGDLDQVLEWQKKYDSDNLRVDMVKQFLDGVPTSHTALVLEEYTDDPGNFGISYYDTDSVEKAVPEAHKRGLSIKLHCCGDRSARMAIDYYENAIKMYGKNQCRHAVEHLEMLSDEDLPRFAELGLVPSVQPEHVTITQTYLDNPYLIVVGHDRAHATWPFKKLYDTAGYLAIGSDCPVVDNNPFYEIHRGVTRLHDDGLPEGGFNSTQRLTVYELLRSYTYGSAYGVCREDEMGTLEDGKLADVVVIDRNLFTVDHSKLRDGQVLLTVMNGNIIYEQEES